MGELARSGLGEVHAVAGAEASRLAFEIRTRRGEAAVLVDEAVPHIDIDDAGLVGAAAIEIVQEWNIGRRALAPQWRQADPEDRHTRRLECRDGVVDPPDVSLAPRISAEFESLGAPGRGRLGSGGRSWFGSIEFPRGGIDGVRTGRSRRLRAHGLRRFLDL